METATTTAADLAQLSINTIRTLSIDAVQQARSGHPGTPMGMAPVVYTLWQNVLRFDPEDPIWPNRDRFVLSAGHASMLLYSMLHLTGVKAVNPKYEVLGQLSVTLDDIRRFRQLGSKCPGHPEYRWTSGVECTTGPLGQGVATSVGLAIGARWLASYFNRPGFTMFDFHTYALCGDGCLMEGISGEAASLAAHLKLNNLCWIYDRNRVTIEGRTDLAFTEDVEKRFRGYGWQVRRVADANDMQDVQRALRAKRSAPGLIIVDSHIGYGAPNKQDTAEAHGEPLGEAEVKLAKRSYGWPEDAQFLVPEGVREHFRGGIGKRGARLRGAWMRRFKAYGKEHPQLAEQLLAVYQRRLPEGWDHDIPQFPADAKGLATRDSSGKVLNVVAGRVPWLIGGSADLAPSTKTRLTFEGAGDFTAENHAGRNFHFGVREHAMGAVLNGLSLAKVRPYGATFLTFSDYCRPAIRLSALMELPVIYIFTHDSIGLGEDGPTHQPVEHLASLRAIPGLVTIRPADANEVAQAWRTILPLEHTPVCLILSRQALPTLDRTKYASASETAWGAYVLADCEGPPEVILMGSGSEVALCVNAYEELSKEGVRARVVSMPSWELFERQDADYRESVLPSAVTARVAVEQASVFGWERYTGQHGVIVGMNTFGASAPLKELQRKFGFTPDQVAAAARRLLERPQPTTRRLSPELSAAVDRQIADWGAAGKIQRLWNGDASLWTGKDEARWVGWLRIAEEQLANLGPLTSFQQEVRVQGFEHAVVLGMGGSSLAPEVLARAFGRQPGFPALTILDSTDPSQIRTLEQGLNLAKTLFVVSSKSGSTLEPNLYHRYFYERMKATVGAGPAGGHFVGVTDPGSPLEAVMQQDGFRHIFHGVKSIGGRYSALSNFGMVPAAAMGLDLERFLKAAKRMAEACRAPAGGNPGLELGAVLGMLGNHGRDKLTVISSPGIADFGAWLEQLIAESTGKLGKGIVPVDGERLGGPEVYGGDRVFAYLRLAGEADGAQDATVRRLSDRGHPVVQIEIAGRYDLGAEFFRWEFATAVAGSLLGINPFDQPDVEASKVETRKLTSEFETTGAVPPEQPIFEAGGVKLFADPANAQALGSQPSLAAYLRAHLGRLGAGDYLALLAYIERNEDHARALEVARLAVRDSRRVATCVGFGPRFLHSTGQAYKGGPNTGVVLQITCDEAADLAVPGQRYTFGVVKAAQARGDFEVLAARGRRALRVHLPAPVGPSLQSLVEAIRAAV